MITTDNFKLKYFAAFLLLFISVVLVYSNSFHGDWHFDDFANIVENKSIRMDSISWPEIKNCIYGVDHERPSRPLSFLSFALNYKLGGLDVFGFHAVNFIIHFLAAVFLFLFIYNTLKLPLLREKYSRVAYPAALIATLFWALNPVWVTSVTYIVQRMASMAGMFCIMSMYFYLKARTSRQFYRGLLLYILCVLTGLAAVLTKENAVMLPVSILLFDLLLIQGATKENVSRYFKFLILPSVLILIFAFIYVDFSKIFDGFALRDFTMSERLLTQPRVILFYLSLLFYPAGSRLTLLYDMEISRTLLQPWTTIPSIALILLIIFIAFYIARRLPFISFCFIFYFLNHFIEGSFFPLEMIYEHRNYLPAMLIFVPCALLFIRAADYSSGNKIMRYIVFLLIAFILLGEGYTTFARNKIISDDYLLWSDNIAKSPKLSRPYTNLGRIYYIRNERRKALAEYEKAIDLNNFGSREALAIQQFNLGLYYFEISEDEKAFDCFKKSSAVIPQYVQNDVLMAKIKLRQNRTKEASEIIENKLKIYPYSSELQKARALILSAECQK